MGQRGRMTQGKRVEVRVMGTEEEHTVQKKDTGEQRAQRNGCDNLVRCEVRHFARCLLLRRINCIR